MNKEYRLIVSHEGSFSLSNVTDTDVQSDYNPGIWCISSQKMALKYAKELLAEGHSVTVTDYENPKYHALANMFIKELGLSQPLFTEPEGLPVSVVTNGMPSTLGALKKFLTVGKKIKIVSTEFPDRSRETEVLQVKTASVVTKKGSDECHLYFEKASNWGFENTGATYYYMTREGKMSPSFKIEYV